MAAIAIVNMSFGQKRLCIYCYEGGTFRLEKTRAGAEANRLGVWADMGEISPNLAHSLLRYHRTERRYERALARYYANHRD